MRLCVRNCVYACACVCANVCMSVSVSLHVRKKTQFYSMMTLTVLTFHVSQKPFYFTKTIAMIPQISTK